MNKKLALLSLSLLMAGGAVAQNTATGQMIGHVSDPDGQPVARAAVKVGERVVAVTDKNGNFTLTKLPAGTRSVTISFIGMKSIKTTVSSTMNVTMEWDNANLDEVMVVAYGTAKKSSFTGSAATIKAEDINKLQVANPVEGLKGRVAGVQIYSNSGRPDGGTPTIRIRGISSINAGNAPLIIVDGAPYGGDLASINQQDIESFSVLKDAASAALYGARGANGVIIITTKRTRSNHGARVTFDSKWGVNQVAQQRYETVRDVAGYYEAYHQALRNESLYENLNPAGGYKLGNEADAYKFANENLKERLGYMVYTLPEGQNLILENGKLNPAAKLGSVVKGKDAAGNAIDYTLLPDDWYDLAYSPSLRQEYNLNVAKGNDNSNIYFSMGYLDNKGILQNTDFKRLTARLKADWAAKDWLNFNTNISYTNSKKHNVGGEGDALSTGSVFALVNGIAPIYPAYLRDGKGNIMVDNMGFTRYDYGKKGYLPMNRPFMGFSNPLSDNALDYSGEQVHTLHANVGADVELGKGFKFVTNNTLYLIAARGESLANPYYGQSAESSKGQVAVGSDLDVRQNFQQILNYSRTFGGVHNVEALVGHEYYRLNSYSLSGSRNNLVDNKNHELGGGLENGTPSSKAGLYNTEGWFARANYSLFERYFASASFRRDASSRFHPNHRWGNFWSLSGAWILSKEAFFKAKWVDELKLKASYGEQGNDGISDYLYTTTYTFKNSNGSLALVPRLLGNENISWEKNGNFNVGVEFSLFKGRLTGQVEVFNRSTHDMLSTYSLPRSYGFTSYYTNIGNMSNRGVEVELNADLVRNSKFTWSVGVNFTHYKNKITSIPDQKKLKEYEGHKGYESGNYFYGEGLPMWTRFLYRSAGVDEKTGEMTYYAWAPRYDLSKPVNVKDANGNEIVDANGKKVQQLDRWGEPVYKELKKKVTDANGKTEEVPVAMDRLTKTTVASEASYFLGKNPHPDLYGGFNTRLAYAGFDLGLDFSFQLGGYILDKDYAGLLDGLSGEFGGSAVHKDALTQSWTPTNRHAKYPRLQAGTALTTNRSYDVDTYYVSASFLSLNNVNFGYTVPKEFLYRYTKGQVQNLRLYVSADNVYYWSARKGLDPRQSVSNSKQVQYSPVRTISGGLTLTF
jgi:tonB-linked outer membrane protein, susC/ragA family